MDQIPYHQVRAVYDERTIRVYQAYSNEIADAALQRGTFVSPPFKMERMTWIKPSFLWMMYRAGWSYKDVGQARILAIDLTREGFEWALENSSSSHPAQDMSKEEWAAIKERAPVRVQWDPERGLDLEPLSYRAIQVGLGGQAVELYVNEWIKGIADVTSLARDIHSAVTAGRLDAAKAMLPDERAYPYAGKALHTD